MLPHPLRVGLAGLIDYAGLFPPASLDLTTTLARFGEYASSADQWLLGRLIVPLPQLGGVAAFVDGLAAPANPPWTVSVLVPAAHTVPRRAGRRTAVQRQIRCPGRRHRLGRVPRPPTRRR